MEALMQGLLGALSVTNIGLSVLGTALGVIIGAIPGLGPGMGVAVCLPITFSMEPASGMLFLMGIYCGAVYGGSVSAILLGIPGTTSNVATVWDGYPMAKRGEGYKALATAVTASLIGGLISAVALVGFSPLLAKFTLMIGPPEYFAITLFGLSIIAALESKSLLKGLISACIGLVLACIGRGPNGDVRYTFGIVKLISGFDSVSVMIGLFTIPVLISNIGDAVTNNIIDAKSTGFKKFMKEFVPHTWLAIKTGVVGMIVGVMPGAGSAISAFIGYNMAVQADDHPENFKKGYMPGIVACESANNGATASSMVPLFTLGIPGSAVAAIFLGALTMHGLRPGNQLFMDYENSGIYILLVGTILIQFYMWVVGMVGAPYFAKTTKAPNELLIPSVLVLSFIGAYASNSSLFCVWIVLAFGILGHVMKRLELSPTSMILAYILGSMLESNLNRSLILSEGHWTIFFTRPIAVIFILITIFLLVWPMVKGVFAKKKAN